MVDFEQGNVQSLLQEYQRQKPKDYATALPQINDDINFNGIIRQIGKTVPFMANSQPMDWAKAALDVKQLDFTKLDHRIAIGKALMFAKHGKSQEQFIKCWRGK